MSEDPEFRYRVEGIAEAPIDVAFRTVADHESYAAWTSCDESFLESKGADDPNGFGAVRVLRDKTSLVDAVIDVRELVNHYWPPYLLGYRVMDTTIVRDHQGIVLFESLGPARTKATWHMTSSPVDPALRELLRPQLQAGVEQLVRDLCAEAERRYRD